MEFCLDGKNPWTAIVVTCQNKAARKAVQVGAHLCLSSLNFFGGGGGTVVPVESLIAPVLD